MDEVTVVVADDEELSRRRVSRLLEEHSDFRAVEVCGSGNQTVHAVERLKPDVLILDVRMPELDGFQVLEHIDPRQRPFVIFLTAFDEFAVKAFDVAAIDYVTKPVDRDRFAAALDRARAAVRADRQRNMTSRLLELMSETTRAEQYLKTITAKRGGRTVVIRTSQIEWIESAENYIRVHVGNEAWLVRKTLAGMEQRLDPKKFARVQRTAIVHLDAVVEMMCEGKDDYVIILRSGARVPLSRLYRGNLESLFDRA